MWSARSPNPVEKDGKPLIGPVEAHGVKLFSIGFFADPDQAIVWRGPMASKALGQLFTDGDWGELDYLLVDLPPGTGTSTCRWCRWRRSVAWWW